ncbi:hypothetical protein H5410_029429, partial [Solanum commersonii]
FDLESFPYPAMNGRGGRSDGKQSLDQVSNGFLSNTNEEPSALVSSSSSESNSEALVALTAGFPSDSLKDEEIEAGVVSLVGGIEQCNYILIRNHIITKWRENVWIWLTKDMFVDIIPERCSGLLDSAYNYLLSYGYVNFGVALAIEDKIPTRPNKGRVIVIGAGLAGLAAARQLMLFGFELSYTLHTVKDQCPLYHVDGMPVDEYLDKKVEAAYNELLDKASKVRQKLSPVISLGEALETLRKDFSVAMNDEEMNLFNWHLANLEYANAVHALAENVPIIFEKTVYAIRYGRDSVKVITAGQLFEGDMALCTVPLGVLKSGSITFIPELPQQKLDTIKRLGFGLLNKVALLFPYVFWDSNVDTFGHVADDSSCRGEFFLFYNYATVAGGPLLLALVAGKAAHKFERMAPTDAVTKVLQILKGIYEPQGINVPKPIQIVFTSWGSDPFSFGSYSNVAVGASGDDYDILAETVGEGRLFFAGEATTRRYPVTMHGAFLTGLREAAKMAYHASVRTSHLQVEKKK